MNRPCSVHGGDVPEREAQLLEPKDETTTGPGAAPRYACRACVRAKGLVPLGEHRLDVASVASEGPA